MKRKKWFGKLAKISSLVTGMLILSGSIAYAQQGKVIQKKLLETGWDQLDTTRFRQNLEQIEKTPFDGVTLSVTGKDDTGKVVSTQSAFSNIPWKKEWFQSSIDDLKAIHSKKVTDNFIIIGANPGNVDWFDDAGWKQIVDHWRIVALIAKEGNLKGIVFDPEPYTASYSQFKYIVQPERDKHSFEEYQAEARLRGKEIISAVAAVDPNLIINAFVMNSVFDDIAASPFTPSAQRTLQTSNYGLYPAFINGWLDAAPPTMIFVDGCETSYRYNSPLEFLQEANVVRNTALNLVAPENRTKYLAQVQTGFAFYLDAYVNPPSSGWYVDPKDSTPTQRLQMNVRSAVNAASEYVWFYGEKYRWWPTPSPGVKPQSWEDVLPGVTSALLSVTHPVQEVDPITEDEQKIAALEKAGELKINLLHNGDFSSIKTNTAADTTHIGWDTVGYPQDWATWQAEGSHGTFSKDDNVNHEGSLGGAARLAGMSNGCFIQTVDVQPGESFVVQGWLHQVGQGAGSIRVGWQTSDDKWINDSNGPSFDDLQYANPWRKLEGIVTAPQGAGKMVVMPSAQYQPSPQDVIWFDDVAVYRMSSQN